MAAFLASVEWEDLVVALEVLVVARLAAHRAARHPAHPPAAAAAAQLQGLRPSWAACPVLRELFYQRSTPSINA